MRPESPTPGPYAQSSIDAFHHDTVQSIRDALDTHEVVVVGMGWNPHVGRARKALEAAGVDYHYVGIGNYLSGWKPRLAVKMWTGWPTFPQVFVSGKLLGGANQVQKALESGPEGLQLSANPS